MGKKIKRSFVSNLFSGALYFGMGLVTFLAFCVPPAPSFQQPELARIIFFHVPCAIMGSLFYIAASWFGFRYLKTKDHHWSIRCSACLEISCLLAALTLMTGMLFSKVQWGTWWQWDPRQTSYLMTFLMLLAALSLKPSIKSFDKAATATASYAVVSLVPVIFLVFIFPRLPHIVQSSFHPSQTLMKGELDANYSAVLRLVALFLLWFCITLYRSRVKIELLERRLEKYDDQDMANTGSRSTITRLDSTVSL